MLLGSKPLSEMSEEELIAGIEELRASREALYTEAKAKAKEKREAPLAKPGRKPKEVDPALAAIFADALRGDEDGD